MLRAAYATGLGTAMLSALGDQQLDRYRASAAAHRLTPRTLTDPELLRHSLQQARRLRLAYDDGEFDPEICCVAAVVRDFSGGAIGAIGTSGPVWPLSLQALHAAARQISRAAAELSLELGYQKAAA